MSQIKTVEFPLELIPFNEVLHGMKKSRPTIMAMIRAGVLPEPLRFGNNLFFEKKAFLRYVAVQNPTFKKEEDLEEQLKDLLKKQKKKTKPEIEQIENHL